MLKHIETMARSIAAKHPAATGVLAVVGLVAVAEGVAHLLKPKASTQQSVQAKTGAAS